MHRHACPVSDEVRIHALMWLHPKSPQSTQALALTENTEEITSCWLAFGTATSDSSWESLKFIYFLTLSTPNRLGREKPRMCTCPHHATKHIPRFFPAHVCSTQTSGEYHEAEHRQKACSDNFLAKNMDLVGMLSTEENKTTLFPPGRMTVLSMGVGTAKMDIISGRFLSCGIILTHIPLCALSGNRDLPRPAF